MNLFDLEPGRFYILDEETIFEFVAVEPVTPLEPPIFGYIRGTPFGPIGAYIYEGDILRPADKCEIDATLHEELPW